MNSVLTPEEIQHRQRLFLEWSYPFSLLKLRLHGLGFKGYLIRKDGSIETILSDVYQREIDIIDEHIQAKANELGLTSQPKQLYVMYKVKLFSPSENAYVKTYNVLNMVYGSEKEAELFTEKQAEEIIEKAKDYGFEFEFRAVSERSHEERSQPESDSHIPFPS